MHLKNGAVVASTTAFGSPEDELLSSLYPELGWVKGEGDPAAGSTDRKTPSVNQPASVQAASGDPVACSADNRTWDGRRESDDHTWRINTGSYPAYLNAAQTTTDLIDGPAGWERFPRTDCGSVPLNSLRQTYAGTTAAMPNFDGAGNCGSRDSQNVWAFRTTSGSNSWIARTCTWSFPIPFADDEVMEADVLFDLNNSATWGNTVNQCNSSTSKYMVSDTATHEAGHIFGFGHVTDSSRQTMKINGSVCSKDQYTLGRGDMINAQNHYAP